jgi:hypothetical protein
MAVLNLARVLTAAARKFYIKLVCVLAVSLCYMASVRIFSVNGRIALAVLSPVPICFYRDLYGETHSRVKYNS